MTVTVASTVLPTYARQDVTIVRGDGCWVEDADGKRYLDLVAEQRHRDGADRRAQFRVHRGERRPHDVECGRARDTAAADELDRQPEPLHLGRDLRPGAVNHRNLVTTCYKASKGRCGCGGGRSADLEDDACRHVL